MGKRVLNVGGGASRDLPAIYRGWDQDLLDIDPDVKPDVLCDAKEMHKLPRATYDAIHCSHTLEHFYQHEVPVVLAGFRRVLRPNGFANIQVPDLQLLFETVVKGNMDVTDIWYHAGGVHAITFHDVLYGWGKAMRGGNLYYAHKCGFSAASLGRALRKAGFAQALVARDGVGNLEAFAFKTKPRSDLLRRLGCL